MIGKKLVMSPEGHIGHRNTNLKDSYVEELKYSVIKSSKKYGYVALVASVRFYVHSISFIKRNYVVAKTKIKNTLDKRLKKSVVEKREVSGFLKMISEYKHKIRKIRHQIKEEENL